MRKETMHSDVALCLPIFPFRDINKLSLWKLVEHRVPEAEAALGLVHSGQRGVSRTSRCLRATYGMLPTPEYSFWFQNPVI